MGAVIFLTGLIKLLLVAAAILGFLAVTFGTPIGIIMLLIKEPTKRALFLILAGPVLLVASFLGWAVINLIAVFWGVKII